MRTLWLLLLLVGAAWATPTGQSPARRALEDERPRAALQLAGRSYAEQLLAVRALSKAGRNGEARRLLQRLGAPPAAERFAFHLVRGQLFSSHKEYDLGRKDLREASRLAATPEEQAEALLERAMLELSAEEGEKAAELLAQAIRVVPTSLALRLARVQLEVLAERCPSGRWP